MPSRILDFSSRWTSVDKWTAFSLRAQIRARSCGRVIHYSLKTYVFVLYRISCPVVQKTSICPWFKGFSRWTTSVDRDKSKRLSTEVVHNRLLFLRAWIATANMPDCIRSRHSALAFVQPLPPIDGLNLPSICFAPPLDAHHNGRYRVGVGGLDVLFSLSEALAPYFQVAYIVSGNRTFRLRWGFRAADILLPFV